MFHESRAAGYFEELQNYLKLSFHCDHWTAKGNMTKKWQSQSINPYKILAAFVCNEVKLLTLYVQTKDLNGTTEPVVYKELKLH